MKKPRGHETIEVDDHFLLVLRQGYLQQENDDVDGDEQVGRNRRESQGHRGSDRYHVMATPLQQKEQRAGDNCCWRLFYVRKTRCLKQYDCGSRASRLFFAARR